MKRGPNKAPAGRVARLALIVGLLPWMMVGSMIDRVDLEGSHTSHLVIAPHPTLRFRYPGGEEGSWSRSWDVSVFASQAVPLPVEHMSNAGGILRALLALFSPLRCEGLQNGNSIFR